MTSTTYDAIVLGLGGMGSAAAYHLSRRGQRVLGLDAFPRGHANGSSHGRSRIIREAYAEAPAYVPLVQRAYALWRELEAAAGRPLLHVTGGLTLGPADGSGVRGVIASARQFGIPYERLSADEVTARFPGFRPAPETVGVWQPNSGYLEPEACTAAHLDLAAAQGADLRHAEPARRWTAEGDGVVVETDAGRYQAARLVIAAGPWAGQILADLALPLTVVRMLNIHIEPLTPALYAPERCPVFGWDVPEGHYYGVPALPDQGLKFGRHDGGEPCTPATARRQVTDDEVAALVAILRRYMPQAAGQIKWTLTCLYTRTPDEHFVIDRHPRHPQVVFGCGFSGHGFKFASVIGEILADLALEGRTAHAIDFLSASRLAPARVQ